MSGLVAPANGQSGIWAPVLWQGEIAACVSELARLLAGLHWTMGTAESCTGGGIAFALTSLSGSSAWFSGGAITYTNALKMSLLGVQAQTLAEHGAVSEAVVQQMAAGALDQLGCQLAVAVSGIAGPGGGSDHKPVGTVCFGWAVRSPDVAQIRVASQTALISGDRHAVRMQTILTALQGCLRQLHSLG